jgi:hypothetical protein
MRYGKTPQLQWHSIIEYTAIIGAIFLVSSVCAAQTAPASEPPKVEWFQKLQKNPELMAELNKLSERLQHGLQYPPARSVSRLLPLMPESTFAYSAIPNYGDMVHQALNIFREELKESSVLRDWWQHGDLATIGPKVEDGLEKFYQVSEFLGDEVVVSGDRDIRNPGILFVAEVRKPGLDNYLQRMLKEIAGESKPHVRILRPQDLATAEERRPPEELIVLVGARQRNLSCWCARILWLERLMWPRYEVLARRWRRTTGSLHPVRLDNGSARLTKAARQD